MSDTSCIDLDMSTHLQPIYDVWDGNAEQMAADIEELGVTVRQWRNRGDIPSRAWPKIIKAAAKKGALLRLEDFLPPEVKEDLPGHGDCGTAEWPIQSATNALENIRDAGEVAVRPFAPPSSPTCSPTNAPLRPRAASPACSDGEVEAA